MCGSLESLPGFKFLCCHLIVVQPWENYWPALRLSAVTLHRSPLRSRGLLILADTQRSARDSQRIR